MVKDDFFVIEKNHFQFSLDFKKISDLGYF